MGSGIFEESQNGFQLAFWCVQNAATESEILLQHFTLGTNVHTGGWGAYEAIDSEKLGLYREKHIHQRKDDRSMEHSNHIEGAPSDLKNHLKLMYATIPGKELSMSAIYGERCSRES